MKHKSHNNRQQNRKRQHFKRNKYCRQSNILLKTKPNKLNSKSSKQPRHKDTQQLMLEEKILSMTAQQSSTDETTYSHYFDNGSNTDPTLYLTDYEILLNTTFAKTLLTVADTQTQTTKAFIKSMVTDEETTTFIRQLTQLINKLNYLKLQIEQWNYYHHLGMNEGIWTGRVSKKMARIFSMCYVYGRARKIVEQRQKKFQLQLTQIQSDIGEHLLKKPSSIVDPNQIINILNDLLITKDQYPLRIELERRRGMLKFDAKDHQYIEIFNKLKPRPSQICLAKSIWKATNDEQTLRYEIAMFKNYFNSKLNNKCHYTIEQLQLTNVDQILTTLLSAQKRTDTQLSKELTEQLSTIAEQNAKSYGKKLNHYMKELFNSKSHVEVCSHNINKAIQDRHQNMIERAEYHTKMKTLLAFPSSINNTN